MNAPFCYEITICFNNIFINVKITTYELYAGFVNDQTLKDTVETLGILHTI